MSFFTEEEFVRVSRHLAGNLQDVAARLHLPPDEFCNLIGAALGEVLAQQLGPFGAVTRLRDMADVVEAQLLTQGVAG